MQGEPNVRQHPLFKLREAVKELRVVEPVEIQKTGDVRAGRTHLNCPVDLGTKVGTAQSEDGKDNGTIDKVGIRHEFRCGECGKRADKKLSSGDEVAAHAKGEAFVNFEAVLAFPVTAFFDEGVSLVEEVFETCVLTEEEGDSHLAEDDIDLLTEGDGVCEKVRKVALAFGIVGSFEREKGEVLEGEADIFFALSLSGFFELTTEFTKFGCVLRFNIGYKLFVDGPFEFLTQ